MPSADNACVVNAPDDDLLKIISTGLENVDASQTIINRGIYTITGQYLGEDDSNLPQGMYIINGNKVIK
jgi:hypothetical protein